VAGAVLASDAAVGRECEAAVRGIADQAGGGVLRIARDHREGDRQGISRGGIGASGARGGGGGGHGEFAIQKGHRYATVIVEPYLRRVLWVGRIVWDIDKYAP